jgi:hypothetical protein
MKMVGIILRSLIVVIMLAIFCGVAFATPSVSITYTETSLAGGLWQYDYTIFNTSDPINDVDYNLYDVFFTFDPSKTTTVVSLPTGWENMSDIGFADTFSLNPGVAPVGTDIGPGASLSGFVFQFDYEVGPLAFDALLFNPLDEANPFVFSGTSAAAATSVPEPSVLMLLGSGIAGLAVIRRRFKK